MKGSSVAKASGSLDMIRPPTGVSWYGLGDQANTLWVCKRVVLFSDSMGISIAAVKVVCAERCILRDEVPKCQCGGKENSCYSFSRVVRKDIDRRGEVVDLATHFP